MMVLPSFSSGSEFHKAVEEVRQKSDGSNSSSAVDGSPETGRKSPGRKESARTTGSGVVYVKGGGFRVPPAKSKVLRHVIDGFVIEESSKPFKVSQFPLDVIGGDASELEHELPPDLDPIAQDHEDVATPDGFSGSRAKGTKDTPVPISETSYSPGSTLSELPTPVPPDADKQVDDWTVDDVYGYISTLGPAFLSCAAKFRAEEIDGAALMLLNPEQMVREPMNLKLGPALKIGKAIEQLKRKRRTS